jgi:hypothetical protein
MSEGAELQGKGEAMMKALGNKTMWVATASLLATVLSGVLLSGAPVDEKRLTTVWIYRDILASGEKNTPPGSEIVFSPYWIQPAEKTDDVTVNDHLAAGSLDKDAKGTICEFDFRLKAREFAEVLFTPGGAQPGSRPGLDVSRALFPDNQTPVVLTFRARTAKDATLKAVFKIGGTAGQDYRDGLRFPELARPSPTKLTDQWQEFSIDLRGKAKELESVICPLAVTIKETDNPGVSTATVYVDDVRFEVRPEPAK